MARTLQISRDDATRIVARVLRERLPMNAAAANAFAVQVADALLANSHGTVDAPPCTDRRRVIRNAHEAPFVRFARSRLVSDGQARALFGYLIDTLAHDFNVAQRA